MRTHCQSASALLDNARLRLNASATLSPFRQGGVLHAMQVLVENAIGKTKHWLKALGQPVPVTADDAFESLHQRGRITQQELDAWRVIVGLRNRIMHDYLNVDPGFVNCLVLQNKHHFIADFLRQKSWLASAIIISFANERNGGSVPSSFC